MTRKNKITPATSPLLFCNHPAWQNTTLLLLSMQYLIIDVNGLSATLEVTVILNKRRYQSINEV